jgi:hypothetical protein
VNSFWNEFDGLGNTILRVCFDRFDIVNGAPTVVFGAIESHTNLFILLSIWNCSGIAACYQSA